MRLGAYLILMAGLLGLTGCGGGSGPTHPVPGPTVSVSDASATEPSGVEGSGVAVFLITLSRTVDQPVTYNWTTRQQLAVAGWDFIGDHGTDTIPPGSTEIIHTITILADDRIEGAETFDLVLSKITNATFADSVGTATIAANGGAGGSVGQY